MAKFKRTKYSKSKSIEKQELGVLEKLFNDSNLLTKLTGGDDDFPAIDGYLHLLNKEREMTGHTLHVQVKPVKYKTKGAPFSICKSELLAYAYESSTPVLLIGVDKDKEIGYWAYLSPELSANFFNQPDDKKTSSITFNSRNIIKKDGPNYVEEWRRICLHHRNESNDRIMSQLVRKRKKESIEKQISPASLETFSDLIFYRTNTGEYPFFDYALSLSPEVCRRDENAKLRYMEILERIYYHRTADVLKILFDLSLDKTNAVADKAKKILLEISKYNFHILNSLGYGPHRLLVDAIAKFILRSGKHVRSLAREMLQNILSSSFEGTSNPDNITITFHRGPLEPTRYLQKIRKDAVNLLFTLFEAAETTGERVEILSAIFHGLHSPDYGFANDESHKDYLAMINKEASDVIRLYKKLAFTSVGILSDKYPVIYEIEHQMVWLKTWKREVKGLNTFIASLRTTKSDYSFYRVIFGEAHDINPDEEYEAARKKKEEDIKSYLDQITLKNIEEWHARLARVATFSNDLKDHRDNWKFNHFRDFLARIGKHKPDIADQLLSSIFDTKDALYLLAGNILFGLRQSSISLWDKYVKRIEKDGSEELTKAILTSFEFHPVAEVKAEIRSKDMKLLVMITRQTNGFSFLKGKQDRLFLYQCMRSALYVYHADPKQCRALIVELFESHPKEASLFFDQMSFALWKNANWLTLEDWDKDELDALGNALVDVERLDHNEEQVLLQVGQRDFNLLISVFDKRLERASKEKTDFSIDPPRFSRYDALPHDFSNQELGEFIRSHQKYKDVLNRWIGNITDEYTSERIELSKLIQFIDGPVLGTAIQELITTGKKENIKKILALFPLMEAPDYKLCFQIIEATDDKEILSHVSGKMRNLGVMSGSYGDDLYGNGLKVVKERLEREGLTHTSQKVKDFSTQMIRDLERDIEVSSEQNRKRLEEEKKEFEESHLD